MIDIYPRAYSPDETRYKFLELVRQRCRWWADETRINSREDLCFGVAHSILSIIDGCAIDFPMVCLTTQPHPDDQEWCIENGENWYPQNQDFLNDTKDHSTLGYQLYHFITPPPPPPVSEMILAEPLELTVSYHFPELEDE